jgi:hypothetical protein
MVHASAQLHRLFDPGPHLVGEQTSSPEAVHHGHHNNFIGSGARPSCPTIDDDTHWNSAWPVPSSTCMRACVCECVRVSRIRFCVLLRQCLQRSIPSV